MDVSFSQTENYLAESPARFTEETVQSLYADDQPKKRIKPNTEHSKLAEAVGFENTIMLNPEEVAKVAARNMNEERDYNKNFGVHTRQTGNFGASGPRNVRRPPYKTTESNDIANNTSLAETRTSVIRGMMNNRQQQNTPESEGGTETEMDTKEYNSLRCYEQVEKDNGDNFSRSRHYLQNNVVDTAYTTQSDNTGHISENFSRAPNSGSRSFQMSGMETRPTSQPYFSQQMRDAAYRVQHPPEILLSQMDARGKQYFERTGIIPGSAISYGPLNAKYNIQDGVFVPSHVEMQSGYPGFARYDRRSPVSNENVAKNNNLLTEQESLKPAGMIIQSYSFLAVLQNAIYMLCKNKKAPQVGPK